MVRQEVDERVRGSRLRGNDGVSSPPCLAFLVGVILRQGLDERGLPSLAFLVGVILRQDLDERGLGKKLPPAFPVIIGHFRQLSGC